MFTPFVYCICARRLSIDDGKHILLHKQINDILIVFIFVVDCIGNYNTASIVMDGSVNKLNYLSLIHININIYIDLGKKLNDNPLATDYITLYSIRLSLTQHICIISSFHSAYYLFTTEALCKDGDSSIAS